MTESVTIKHPTAGTSQVAPSAVPHWRSLGWEPVEENKPAAAEQAGEHKKSSGRSRRRTSEESEQ